MNAKVLKQVSGKKPGRSFGASQQCSSPKLWSAGRTAWGKVGSPGQNEGNGPQAQASPAATVLCHPSGIQKPCNLQEPRCYSSLGSIDRNLKLPTLLNFSPHGRCRHALIFRNNNCPM